MEDRELNKEEITEVSMDMIVNAGQAKSAIMSILIECRTKENVNYGDYEGKLKEAEEFLAAAGKAHHKVLVNEGNNHEPRLGTLFMHAEDQFITTQLLLEMAKEMIHMYSRISK